jgi:hypothetical protein
VRIASCECTSRFSWGRRVLHRRVCRTAEGGKRSATDKRQCGSSQGSGSRFTNPPRDGQEHHEGQGRIGIAYGSNPDTCPVRMIQTWLEIAGISNSGPLFRSISRHGCVQPGRLSGIDVARVVKKLAERAGLDPAKYAGHSLRAGDATAAAIAGASERSIMNQTGHRSVQMVRRSIRDGSLFRENSAGKLGL